MRSAKERRYQDQLIAHLEKRAAEKPTNATLALMARKARDKRDADEKAEQPLH